MASDAVTLTIPAPVGSDETERTVRLSSPHKPVWPDGGDGEPVTKLDLANYLVAVAEPFLAANGDRPVALQRVRGGVDGEMFYSKNPPKGTPAWVQTTMCTYPSGRSHPQIVLSEIATAVWAAQMNTVTFHPWPVLADDNDHVDELRIDLDPQPGRAFSDIVEAARGLRDLLAELGLVAWVKTSGSRGIHVYSRIERTHEFLDVRHAVIGIARELERRLPDLVTTAWWKEQRGDRIFIDYNQACRDRTIAGAYSPRVVSGARVSMPVTWDELPEVDASRYTVRTVPAIVAERGDAWAEMSAPQNIGHIGEAYALWEADLERGLGELNFPPDHPKMPGEPPRVQPSKKNAANWEADGVTPRSEK